MVSEKLTEKWCASSLHHLSRGRVKSDAAELRDRKMEKQPMHLTD